jgi:hypothetical protein
MSGPYFQKHRWPDFAYQGQRYGLSHLDEYVFSTDDSQAVMRQIVVTFEDHCFTREWEAGDDAALIYPPSSRKPGCFCIDRYQHSLQLPTHIQRAAGGAVWNIQGDNFAIVPTVTQEGLKVLYGIVFSLDPVKGLPVDLHMRVKTAYPCDEKDIVTYGSVRFRHLVTLRMQKKRPGRIVDRGRKRPKVDMR